MELNLEALYTQISEIKSFDTPNDAKVQVNSFSSKLGFVVNIQRSDKLKKKLILGCAYSGAYRGKVTDEDRKRKTTSRKRGCPFQIRLMLRKTGAKKGFWTWRAFNETFSGEHNHDCDPMDITAEPEARVIAAATNQIIKQGFAVDLPPKDILLTVLERDGSTNLTSKDISNLKAKRVREMIGNSTSTQIFLDHLEAGQWIYDYDVEEGRLKRVVFVSTSTFPLLRRYRNVLLMDSTYKTNKKRMPMLDVVGITATLQTFPIAIGFLDKETETDYRWMLETLRRIMSDFNVELPSVLITDRELALTKACKDIFAHSCQIICEWHVRKNVTDNISKIIKQQNHLEAFEAHWSSILRSQSEVSYQANVKGLRDFCTEIGKIQAYNYIDKTWLSKLKDSLVAFKVDQYMHFNQKATSRVEGQHSKFKKYIRVSTKDLVAVLVNLEQSVEDSVRKIKHINNKQANSVPLAHRKSARLSKLTGKVAHHVLSVMEEQLRKALHALSNPMEDLPPCSRRLRTVMDLPCAHELMTLHPDSPIPLEMIGLQWRLCTGSSFTESVPPSGRVSWRTRTPAAETAQDQDLPEDFALKDAFLALHKKFVDASTEQQGRLKATLEELIRTDIPDIRSPRKMEALRGRPPGRKNNPISSTRRDPSRFELNDHGNRKKTCKLCHHVGHNSRTCNKRRGNPADDSQDDDVINSSSEVEAEPTDSDAESNEIIESGPESQDEQSSDAGESTASQSGFVSEPSAPPARKSGRLQRSPSQQRQTKRIKR